MEEEAFHTHITRILSVMLGRSQKQRTRQLVTLPHIGTAKLVAGAQLAFLFSSFQDPKSREGSRPHSACILLSQPDLGNPSQINPEASLTYAVRGQHARRVVEPCELTWPSQSFSCLSTQNCGVFFFIFIENKKFSIKKILWAKKLLSVLEGRKIFITTSLR